MLEHHILYYVFKNACLEHYSYANVSNFKREHPYIFFKNFNSLGVCMLKKVISALAETVDV